MSFQERVFPAIAATHRSAVGIARVLRETPDLGNAYTEVGDVRSELLRFDAALAHSREQLETLREEGRSEEAGSIVDGQLLMLADPEVIRGVIQLIKRDRWGALRAVDHVIDSLCQKFSGLDDPYLAAREADLQDIGTRIRKNLIGVDPNEFDGITEETVLVAKELAPSTIVQLETIPFAGIVMECGAATSHAAILARGLNMPCLVGAAGILEYAQSGHEILLDGESQEVILHPSADTKSEREERLAQPAPESSAGLYPEGLRTLDGQRVQLRANISLGGEVRSLSAFGAEGVGLFRTEMLFMGKSRGPAFNQQVRSYKRVLKTAGEQVVTFRTMDAGGDKDLPFLHPPEEENPALGQRSIRLSLHEGKVFKRQLRALLQAGTEGNMRLMYPMITTLEELHQANAVLEEVKAELEEAGEPYLKSLKAGMMVEVPAVALRLADFAPHAEFFSVGTNDLIQFLFAADRGNASVAHLTDGAHPAFLRIMKEIAQTAAASGVPVSCCGELPTDPVSFTLLLGLGFREFSMNLFAVPRNRLIASRIDTRDLTGLAEEALQKTSAKDVRALVRTYLAEVLPAP